MIFVAKYKFWFQGLGFSLVLTSFDNETDFLKFKEIDPENIICEKVYADDEFARIFPEKDTWAWDIAREAGFPAVKYLEAQESKGI